MHPRTITIPALLMLAASATLQAQWQIQQSNSTASLRGITTAGDGIAWASGTGGTVLHTTDGGAHWQTCPTPPGAEHLDFRGSQAFDAQTAIVMSSGKGDLSRLYKTTDACQTWKLLFTNPDKDGFWDAIRFYEGEPHQSTDKSGQIGFLVGDPVNRIITVFETDDSGEHWLRWEDSGGAPPSNLGHFPAKAADGEALFAASNSALVVPGSSGPFAFITGGKGGARLFIPEPHSPFDNGTTMKFAVTKLPMISSESAGGFALASRTTKQSESDLMAVGGDYRAPDSAGSSAFLPSRNECCFGLLPRKVISPSTPPLGYRSSVAYDRKSKTWITVGPNGTDISTDDGRNWRALKPNPPPATLQTQTATGTPSRSPSSSAPTAASASFAPTPFGPQPPHEPGSHHLQVRAYCGVVVDPDPVVAPVLDPDPVVEPALPAAPVPVVDPNPPAAPAAPAPPAPIPIPELNPRADPSPVAFVLAGPPPSKLTFAFMASIRGSYRNSHVGYVVCSFTTTIESPVAALPTPRNGAPPPVKLVAD